MRGTGWWRFLSLLHPRNAPWPSPAPGTLSDDCTLVAIDGVAKPFTTAWSPMCFFDRPLLQCACRRLPQYVHAFQRASFLPAPSCLFFFSWPCRFTFVYFTSGLIKILIHQPSLCSVCQSFFLVNENKISD